MENFVSARGLKIASVNNSDQAQAAVSTRGLTPSQAERELVDVNVIRLISSRRAVNETFIACLLARIMTEAKAYSLLEMFQQGIEYSQVNPGQFLEGDLELLDVLLLRRLFLWVFSTNWEMMSTRRRHVISEFAPVG